MSSCRGNGLHGKGCCLLTALSGDLRMLMSKLHCAQTNGFKKLVIGGWHVYRTVYLNSYAFGIKFWLAAGYFSTCSLQSLILICTNIVRVRLCQIMHLGLFAYQIFFAYVLKFHHALV